MDKEEIKQLKETIAELKENQIILKVCQANIKDSMSRQETTQSRIWWTILGLGLVSIAERYFLGV